MPGLYLCAQRIGSLPACRKKAGPLPAVRHWRARFFCRETDTPALASAVSVLTGSLPEDSTLTYPITRVLSGAYVQDYFAEAQRLSLRMRGGRKEAHRPPVRFPRASHSMMSRSAARNARTMGKADPQKRL